jgi:hypothetical protein
MGGAGSGFVFHIATFYDLKNTTFSSAAMSVIETAVTIKASLETIKLCRPQHSFLLRLQKGSSCVRITLALPGGIDVAKGHPPAVGSRHGEPNMGLSTFLWQG